MKQSTRVYLAGHRGLVGSAVMRRLEAAGYTNIITRTHNELDLTHQADVKAFFEAEKPEVVILAAARVGGILANDTYKAEFIYQNLQIASNVIHAAWKSGVTKLLNLGSSCIYPKMAQQPMNEDALLTGPLESTNEPYAIAKIAAIKLCRYYNEQYGRVPQRHDADARNATNHGTNFVSAMPTNLYGPGCMVTARSSLRSGTRLDPSRKRSFRPGPVTTSTWRRATCCRRCWVEGRDPLGLHQTQRHPPQADGREQDDRARVDCPNRPAGRNREDLGMVPRERTGPVVATGASKRR